MIKNNKIFNSCLKAGGVLFCVFVAALFAVLGAKVSYAQTAMVTSASTNYPLDTAAVVNYQCISSPDDDWDVSFIYNANSGYGNLQNNLDPWHNSGLIEYDQPFYGADTVNKYPNHCLQLCAEVTCINPSRKVESSDGSSDNSIGIIQDVGSSDFPIQSVLFEVFKYQPNSNPYNADTTPPIRTIALTPTEANICPGVGTYTTGTGDNERMHSCCDLIGEAVSYKCMSGNSCNTFVSSETCNAATGCSWVSGGSCVIKKERTICGNYHSSPSCLKHYGCYWNPSASACQAGCGHYTNEYDCFHGTGSTTSGNEGKFCEWQTSNYCDYTTSSSCSAYTDEATCEANSCSWVPQNGINPNYKNCVATQQNFLTKEDCLAGRKILSFCTAWDGSYEIDGEFGKSNGQFGFRANIKTKWPGDGISSGGDVEVDHTMAYPGENQIPIQIDVTNVHSVRSSSTIVGATTKVPVQPYDITYKLSKDALTTITITDPGEVCGCKPLFSTDTAVLVPLYASDCTAPTDIITFGDFDLINKQPRLGEGIPNGVNANLDSWDGRDQKGSFLPYGNYLVAITATTHDEWSGLDYEDLSRTVTRQLSLDPLKITDIKETGLTKFSTSYAKIDYVITESANVHVLIFTPGTYFDSVDMETLADPYDHILSQIHNGSGKLVDHIVEQKQGRVGINTKWDGICRNSDNTDQNNPDCSFGGKQYLYGTPMPDGDYVYVMWAEIPYASEDWNGYNVPRAICVNGKWWAGVRTRKYHNGILAVNRGLPEITVGAVGYTSLGSSPTAFGLDPFTFNYAVSRDSIVDVTIKTTAPDISSLTDQVYTVKHLLTNEVAVAAKENKFTWDGIDDEGYQVAPGTYMVEVVAKDSLYPEKQATMTVQFPVDMFRVVDVSTKPILDEATSQAKINYTLSKSVDVVVEIYDQDVTIPTDDANWCHYSASSTTAYGYVLDPIDPNKLLKSFVLPKAGEGMTITEVWDGLQESIASTSAVAPWPDGNYPYRICTRTTQPISHWYKEVNGVHVAQNGDYVDPLDPTNTNLYPDGASDKPTGFITIARGSIAFNKVLITPSQPEMKYSSETVYLPSYEIALSTSRPASINIEVISTQDGQCEGGDVAGTTCRILSAYAYDANGIGYFDPTKTYKVYWDGKDSKGEYVKYGSYEIKLKGLPYPLPISYQSDLALQEKMTTIYSQVISVNNFQVYDRYVEDITRDNPNAKFAYQISVPMKVAIQIFKPGTTTNRNSTTATGLVDPVTGQDVANTNIDDVLVKSIVGIRPNLVSLDEVWDGTDYAGQEVPDGIYPYRYVTVLNAYDMDSVTGALNVSTDTLPTAGAVIADWEKYITLENINVARGDSWYADVDWKSKKVTSFFPNPLNKDYGWFEIAKLPAPGRVSIKIYNIAGDLVREGNDFDCINSQGETDKLATINANGGLQPYMNLTQNTQITSSRNFTLRCKWEKDNDHGKKVARGLYYAIMELDPTRGNAKKSQRVIKILIP